MGRTARHSCASRRRSGPTAGYLIQPGGIGASSALDRRLLLDPRIASGLGGKCGAAGLAAEDVATPCVLALQPEIVGLLRIDLHLADRIGLVHRLWLVRHGAPPPNADRRRDFRRA